MSEQFRRVRSLGESEVLAEDGRIRLLASTAEAVNWGGWREVLLHDEGCVDMSAARSLLINHNPDQLAGGISGMALDGKEMVSDAEIDEDARMPSGVSVRKSVAKGRLNGVSIGYTYSRADADYDEESRTLTVRKWRLLEISLTPIPADARAQVRSLPFDFTESAIPADPSKEARVSDPIKPNPQGPESAPIINVAESVEKVRAQAYKESNEIAKMADSLGLRSADFVGMSKPDAQEAMIRARAEKDKTKEPEQALVSIKVDAADKARDAAIGAICHAAGRGDAKSIEGNPLAGRGFQSIVKRYAAMVGERSEGWEKEDVAFYALGKTEMIRGRSSANVVTASFPNFVFLNAITKIVAKGYEAGAPSAQYRRIVSNNTVPDFKQFSIGALGMGNLQKTLENVAFPELDKAEGVYNSTAKMWGGTISLSLQAAVNDDTGELLRKIGQAGVIADKTIDRRTFQKLLMGTSAVEATSTWTSNTSSGCSPVWTTADTLAAARAKVNVGMIALMNKVGLDGNPLGTMPRFLVGGPTVGGYLRGLKTGVPGQTVGNAYSDDTEVVVSPWMENSALTGYSTTTFYALASAEETTGLVLTKVAGFDSIQVMPYDAGATAALNYKLFLPFEVDLHYMTVGSTATVAAAQQCTT